MSKIDRLKRRDYFRKQKLFGLAMIIFGIVFPLLGVAVEATECGALLLAIPAGLYLIFTKDMVLDFSYKLELEQQQKAQ